MPKDYQVGDQTYSFPDEYSDEQVQGILTKQGIIKPVNVMRLMNRRADGMQAQKGEPAQPTGGDEITTLGNLYGGMGLGAGIKGVAGMVARPALAAMMGAGTNAAAGGSALEGGLESGALGGAAELGGQTLGKLFKNQKARKSIMDALKELQGQNLPVHNAPQIKTLEDQLGKTIDPKKVLKGVGIGGSSVAGLELLREFLSKHAQIQP